MADESKRRVLVVPATKVMPDSLAEHLLRGGEVPAGGEAWCTAWLEQQRAAMKR